MAENQKNVIIITGSAVTPWTFRSFVSGNRDVSVDWDTTQTFAAEQAFISMVKDCIKVDDHLTWTAYRHPMNKQAGEAGVIELGFKADKKPYRVLCKFDGHKQVVVLCIAYHKGKVWVPHDAVNTATKRAKIVSSRKAKLNDIQIDDTI